MCTLFNVNLASRYRAFTSTPTVNLVVYQSCNVTFTIVIISVKSLSHQLSFLISELLIWTTYQKWRSNERVRNAKYQISVSTPIQYGVESANSNGTCSLLAAVVQRPLICWNSPDHPRTIDVLRRYTTHHGPPWITREPAVPNHTLWFEEHVQSGRVMSAPYSPVLPLMRTALDCYNALF